MAIVPDDKDWTWVLREQCPECGFKSAEFQPTDVADAVRQNAADWNTLLAHDQASQRPSEDRWSALEYGCHVRDVFRLYDFRLGLMLANDGAKFPNWDQDQTAVEQQYHLQDPAVVSREITEAASGLAARFGTVQAADWTRTGYRSDGAAFTVSTFAQYMIHDPIHHVHDAEQGFQTLAAS